MEYLFFLFIIPFIGVIIYSLSINKKIVNKKVFWLLIPIILLSSTFFVFNNSFFRMCNFVVISIFIDVMIICLFGFELGLSLLINSIIDMLFKPIGCIGNVINLLKLKISNISYKKRQDNNRKKDNSRIGGFVIITIIVMG